MLRFIRPIVFAAVAMMFVSCGDNGDTTPEGSRGGLDTAQLAPPGQTVAPADTSARADSVNSEPAVTHTAVISTSAGDIEVELYGKDAPRTVKNFVELANKKYYDGVAFHRVIPGFMVQTGDPLSRDSTKRELWGEGGESIYGDSFEDELDQNTPSGRRGYRTGTLAMANAGPNTNGSQFFIVLTSQGASHLTYNYTIFGQVRSGMEVVEKIGETGLQGEKPITPARIKTIATKEIQAIASAGTTTR